MPCVLCSRPNEQIYHGVIGLKTTHGSGSSTVAEYAAAAAGLDLQFLVFVDEYRLLTNASLAALTAECKVNTTACKRLFSLGCVAHTDGSRCVPGALHC